MEIKLKEVCFIILNKLFVINADAKVSKYSKNFQSLKRDRSSHEGFLRPARNNSEHDSEGGSKLLRLKSQSRMETSYLAPVQAPVLVVRNSRSSLTNSNERPREDSLISCSFQFLSALRWDRFRHQVKITSDDWFSLPHSRIWRAKKKSNRTGKISA